jgi:DNA polymerase III delta subunit
MLTILHGDDEVKVHGALVREIETAKERHVQIVRLSGKGLSISDLENALGTQELFASEKLVIIDGLFSLPKSKNKDELIAWIGNQESKNKNQGGTQAILVEGKVLTASQLKSFPTAKVSVFKLPMMLFQFVESIGLSKPEQAITQFHAVIETQDAEFVFVMIVRQVRMLIGFVADHAYDGPPFGRQKIERQARAFTLEKLLRLHAQLSDIDFRQKTSRNALTLVQEIDLWLANI